MPETSTELRLYDCLKISLFASLFTTGSFKRVTQIQTLKITKSLPIHNKTPYSVQGPI